MKILILKFKTIGDVLLITPLVDNLKYHYPLAQIDLAINIGTEEMLTLNPKVGNIWVYDRPRVKAKKLFNKIKSEFSFLLKIRRQKYDMVIDLDYGDRGAIIASISRAKIKIGSNSVKALFFRNTYTHFFPSKKGKHIAEVGLDAIRILGKEPRNKKISIYWSSHDEKFIDNLSLEAGFIHIHPFSRVTWKEVNTKIVAKIIDYCQLNLGHSVVITSASNKRELKETDKLLNYCKSKPVNLSGRLTLKQTAALNKKAKLFIGVDTAIMHISSANNTPIFAFFGPTAVDNWGPWDNDLQSVNYTRIGGLQQNGKHIVYSEDLPCIGCNKHGCNDKFLSNCLNTMDIDSIKKNLKSIIYENKNIYQ